MGEGERDQGTVTVTSMGRTTVKVYCLLGAVFPGLQALLVLLRFGAKRGGSPDTWQSGEWSVYARQALKDWAIWPMAALTLFAAAGVVSFLFGAAKLRWARWVRCALVLGMVVGTHGCVHVALVIPEVGWFLLIYPFGVAAHRRMDAHGAKGGEIPFYAQGGLDLTLGCVVPLCLAVLVAAGFGMLATVLSESDGDLQLWLVPLAMFVTCIVSSPAGLLVVCAMALARWDRSAGLGDCPRERVPQPLLFTALAAYLAAASWQVTQAIRLYEQLPAEPPPDKGGCYVVTAAAHGHPRLVGARRTRCPDGSVRVTSRQLETLKAAELALCALLPRTHRGLRRIYDRIGPPVASRVSSRAMADAAYVALLPLEWCARSVLRGLDAPIRAGRRGWAAKVPERHARRAHLGEISQAWSACRVDTNPW